MFLVFLVSAYMNIRTCIHIDSLTFPLVCLAIVISVVPVSIWVGGNCFDQVILLKKSFPALSSLRNEQTRPFLVSVFKKTQQQTKQACWVLHNLKSRSMELPILFFANCALLDFLNGFSQLLQGLRSELVSSSVLFKDVRILGI